MGQIYKRVDDINEKVKNASLPYLEWKVLFLVGEATEEKEIAEWLPKDITELPDILSSLESKGLIEQAASEKKEKKAAPVTETEEEPVAEALKADVAEVADTEEDDFSLDLLSDSSEESDDKEPETETVAEVDSESEEDSTFSAEEFDLGIGDNSAATDETEKEEPVAEEVKPVVDDEIISDVSKKTIVVIDDSIVIRKMIEIALEEEDLNIVTAISGKDGLDLIEKLKPNLVILDMMLPDMNGIDVLKTIKQKTKIPVIMLSGKDSPQLIESAKEVGVDDFLPKPFRDEELVEKVKTLTGA